MLSSKKIAALALLFVALFSACKENETTNPSTATTLKNGLSGLFESELTNSIQKFKINISPNQPITIKGKAGTTITFTYFWNSKGAVTGEADVELIELYQLSDFLFLNKPTVGYDPSTKSNILLKSAGSFYVSVKQNGTPVEINYSISTKPNQTIDKDMTLWSGEANSTNSNSSFVWQPLNRKPYNCVDSLKFGSYCIDFIRTIGWVNLDAEIRANGLSKTVVKLPTEYNDKNAHVFFGRANNTNSLAKTTYDNNEWLPLFNLPANFSITLIVMVIDSNNLLRYNMQTFTTKPSQVIEVTDLTPITLDELKAKVNAL